MDSTVKIILDSECHSACYPGQTISGRVECFFDKEKKVRGIPIKFKGSAKTRWSVKSGKSSTTYMAEENYFYDEYNLISGGDEFCLPAGKHTYPFSYILPPSLPSPFEGTWGRIRYSIKATVDRPWKFDYEDKLALNVVSLLDLNQLPELRQPLAVSVDKEVSYGCCRTSPLNFKISLPATGFAGGQQMDIGAFVQNMSNVTAERVDFRIMLVTEFISHSPCIRQRYEEQIFTQGSAGAIEAHAEKAWTSSLTIPSYNLNLIPCSIINTTYHLEAEVVLPFPHFNLKTALLITIGSVPLTGVNTGLLGPPPQISTYPSNSYATAPPVQGGAATSASGDKTCFLDGNTTSSHGRAPYAVEDKFGV